MRRVTIETSGPGQPRLAERFELHEAARSWLAGAIATGMATGSVVIENEQSGVWWAMSMHDGQPLAEAVAHGLPANPEATALEFTPVDEELDRPGLVAMLCERISARYGRFLIVTPNDATRH